MNTETLASSTSLRRGSPMDLQKGVETRLTERLATSQERLKQCLLRMCGRMEELAPVSPMADSKAAPSGSGSVGILVDASDGLEQLAEYLERMVATL